MKKIKRFLLKLLISMSLAMMTFTVLSIFNPMMGFLNSKVSKVYIFVYAVTVIATAVICFPKRK